MWTPIIVSIAVIFITIILLCILEKKEKIKRNTKAYRIIEILGVYIPTLIMCAYYAYLKTDTLKETIIVTIGIVACFNLWLLFQAKWKTSKYGYILFLIMVLCSFIIIKIISRYMLSDIYSVFYPTYLGSILGSSFIVKKYKWRLIITEIIVIVMVIMWPLTFANYFESDNKVERISIGYSESIGYDITSQDEVSIWKGSTAVITRNEPIRVLIVRHKSEQDWTAVRCLNLVYSNGEIIKFSREK